MENYPAQSLLGFPTEVWDLILAHLPKDDLRIVCLVNRHLRTLAEPFLYSDIHFTWGESQHHPITSLLRSLLGRPELATHVRRVSLLEASLWTVSHEKKIPVSESELEAPLAFIQKTTVSYRENWVKELRDGTIDAFVAVLLSQPLHLTDLSLDFDLFQESQFICLAFRSMLFESQDCGLQLDLRYLQSVSLEIQVDDDIDLSASSTADILLFFYLPSVKQISACFEHPVMLSWPVLYPPSSPYLHTLTLRYIREPFVAKLLSATNQLLSLEWDWLCDQDYKGYIQTRVIDLTQITAAISPVRGTLTELVLQAFCAYSQYPYLSIQGSLKGITKFHKLAKFTVPIVFLTGSFEGDITKRIEDCLPRSLEYLVITEHLAFLDQYAWDDEELFSVLEAWLGTFKITTPLLRKVKLEYQPSRPGTKRPMEKRPIEIKLKALCDRVGVSFEFIELVYDFRRRNF